MDGGRLRGLGSGEGWTADGVQGLASGEGWTADVSEDRGRGRYGRRTGLRGLGSGEGPDGDGAPRTGVVSKGGARKQNRGRQDWAVVSFRYPTRWFSVSQRKSRAPPAQKSAVPPVAPRRRPTLCAPRGHVGGSRRVTGTPGSPRPSRLSHPVAAGSGSKLKGRGRHTGAHPSGEGDS